MSSEIEKITIRIISRNFELDDAESEKTVLKKIREKLIDKIEFLLVHDFGKLLSILYRIDVDESKAKKILAETPHKKPSEVLADLIIEREMEKAKARTKYQPPKGDL